MTILGGPCETVLIDFKSTCRKCQDYTTRVIATVDDAFKERRHELSIEMDIPVLEIRGSFSRSKITGSKTRKHFDFSANSSNGKLNFTLQIYFKYFLKKCQMFHLYFK